MTVLVTIECPYCHSTEVTKYGKSPGERNKLLGSVIKTLGGYTIRV